jgi:hypothetical protein
MLRPVATFIDDYRIWHKVTFRRGRILITRGAWEDLADPALLADPGRHLGTGGRVPDVRREPERSTPLADIERFSSRPRPLWRGTPTRRATSRTAPCTGIARTRRRPWWCCRTGGRTTIGGRWS